MGSLFRSLPVHFQLKKKPLKIQLKVLFFLKEHSYNIPGVLIINTVINEWKSMCGFMYSDRRCFLISRLQVSFSTLLSIE